MVLAGVGIDHQQLVDLGNKYFSVPKSETNNTGEQMNQYEKAVWTGGAVMVIDLILFYILRIFQGRKTRMIMNFLSLIG